MSAVTPGTIHLGEVAARLRMLDVRCDRHGLVNIRRLLDTRSDISVPELLETLSTTRAARRWRVRHPLPAAAEIAIFPDSLAMLVGDVQVSKSDGCSLTPGSDGLCVRIWR